MSPGNLTNSESYEVPGARPRIFCCQLGACVSPRHATGLATPIAEINCCASRRRLSTVEPGGSGERLAVRGTTVPRRTTGRR